MPARKIEEFDLNSKANSGTAIVVYNTQVLMAQNQMFAT